MTQEPEAPEQDFENLLEYLRDARGFDFTGYKRASLRRRIVKRMEIVGIAGFMAYQDHLQVHPDEFTQLFNFILINVTGFFRDPAIWDYLAERIIPKMLEQKEPQSPLRVWCAGCASGEEAYSVAMLIAEAVGKPRLPETIKIYGTDIDDEALVQARQAIFTDKSVQAIPPQLRAKYFDASNGTNVFNRELRRSVIFGRHDLVQDAPISKVDFLVCRNTLMYFNAETQARVMDHFHFALNEGGVLLLGKAEMLFTNLKAFTPIDLKRRFFTKRNGGETPRGRLIAAAAQSDRDAGAFGNHVRGRELAFDSSPVAQLLVDRRGYLVLANRKVKETFGLSDADPGRLLQDLSISYRPLELRSLIEQVYVTPVPVKVEDIQWITPSGREVVLESMVTPLFDDGGRILGVSITFDDVTRFKRLQADLEHSTEELQTAMEELQSTNEELETTNEELQSTNEELETTNEELQSTNEELETMNEEVQSTNEELQAINNELRERSVEVGSLNSYLESILVGLRGAVVVVDGDVKVQLWHGRAEELWGLSSDEVVGTSFFDLDSGLPVAELRKPLQAALDGDGQPGEVWVEAVNRRGRPITVKITCMPLVPQDGEASSGAVVFIEEEDSTPSG